VVIVTDTAPDTTDSTLPPALRRALDLLTDPPAEPNVRDGYLDLLGGRSDDDGPTRNTGSIQAMWASDLGSLLYDNLQLVSRRLFTAMNHPHAWLDLPADGIALDVGSGPGNVTAALARSAGPDGLALGVDISVPMLTRAVKAEAGNQVGFLRADAQQLPLRDETVHAVVSIAMMQLIPDPAAALGEMVRVLRPGGRLAVMVPTASSNPLVMALRFIPNNGAHFFDEDEIADVLEDNGLSRVRVRQAGPVQWVRGQKPA
jgi:SAM-dependent methyltransferase